MNAELKFCTRNVPSHHAEPRRDGRDRSSPPKLLAALTSSLTVWTVGKGGTTMSKQTKSVEPESLELGGRGWHAV
jgi:hypothetical protein